MSNTKMTQVEIDNAMDGMLKVAKSEREIVLTRNASEKTWHICCDDPSMVKKLLAKGMEPSRMEGTQIVFENIADKALSFRKPTGRNMTEEQREAAALRMQKMHAARKGGMVADDDVDVDLEDEDVEIGDE